MNDQLSKETKKLRKHFARTFHNDGLIDFFVGWALVSAGIFMQTGLFIFSFLGWMPIMLILPLKQLFVVPRYGYVKFKESALIPRPITLGAGAVLVVGSLLYTFLSRESGFSASLAVAILGLGLLFSIDRGLSRVGVYGIFIPLLFFIGLGLKILSPILVILVGAVLMGLGLYLFLTFIKKYPLESGEEINEE